MDFDIWYSLAAGVVGALVGGIIPYRIHTRNEKMKKDDVRIEYLYKLLIELDRLGYASSQLYADLIEEEKKITEVLSEENIEKGYEFDHSATENYTQFVNSDVITQTYKLPHYALHVDEETHKFVNDKIEDIMDFMSRMLEEYKNEESYEIEVVERTKKYFDSHYQLLSILEDKVEELQFFLKDKRDNYYKKYHKKYIKD